MIATLVIPDTVWGNLASAFFGAGIASALVAYFTQGWIERRELRARRDVLRIDLYADIVAVILENELAIAAYEGRPKPPPTEHQLKSIGIAHRLALFGSTPVTKAYETYRMLVFRTISNDLRNAPLAEEVVRARDVLVELMQGEVRAR